MKIELTKQFSNLLEEKKINLYSIQQAAGLPLVDSQQLELDSNQYIRLMETMDHFLDNEKLLILSDITNIQQFMPAFFAALASPNGLTAVRRFARYKKLVGHVDVELTEDSTTIRIAFTYQGERIPRFMLLNEQLLVISMLRTGSGQEVIPAEIAGPFAYGNMIEAYIKTKGQSQTSNQLIFLKKDLNIPFITENNVMWTYLDPSLEKELADWDNQNLSGRVQELLIETLPGNEATIDNIEQKFGMSNRTPQRKLKEEGNSFKDLVKCVQIKLAQTYLQQGISNDEVAYLVGYTETSSFLRAFKRWTGQTVGQYLRRSA